MSLLDQITVLVLAYNESANIGRTLAALERFKEVVVLDSGSTDGTHEIVRKFSNARMIHREFQGHADQWNYGLAYCGITTPWVLAIDADYVLPGATVDEIGSLAPQDSVGGFRARFRYCVNGHPLSGSLYPPVTVLFRRQLTHYIQDGHTQRAIIRGKVSELKNIILHDDRKSLSRWIASQQSYAKLEAKHLLSLPGSQLRLVDRIRLTALGAPVVVFFFTLLWKQCIFDGWPGIFYALQRTLAETLIALELINLREEYSSKSDFKE